MRGMRRKCGLIQRLAGEESGQGVVEYALILLSVALAVIAGLSRIAPPLIEDFNKARNGLL